MNLAIIDCGTNTFNLLIASLEKDRTLKFLHQSRISVKLGEGGINKNIIEEKAFKRGIDAIQAHFGTIFDYDIDRVKLLATSAIREAFNGKYFVEEVFYRFGTEILVIDGNQEAEMTYEGVKASGALSKDNSLIMDIGGGSTEFIIGNENTILWKQSFRIGVARLLDQLQASDPISPEEKQQAFDFLEEQLTPLKDAIIQYPVKELIGSAGSFESIVEMTAFEQFGKSTLDDGKHFRSIELSDFHGIKEQIYSSTLKDRLQIPGLIAMRADMIVMSMLLIQFVVDRFSITQIRQTDFALKEGALYRLFDEKL